MKTILNRIIAILSFIFGILLLIVLRKKPDSDSQEIINNAQNLDNQLSGQANEANNEANNHIENANKIDEEIKDLSNNKDLDWHKNDR